MGAALLLLLRGKSDLGWRVLSWITLLRSGWSSRWCRLQCLGAVCQSWRFLEEFPLLRCLPRRAVRPWKFGLCLCHRFFQSFWCMGVACGVRRIGSGRVRCLVQQWIHVLREAFDEFQHFSTLR